MTFDYDILMIFLLMECKGGDVMHAEESDAMDGQVNDDQVDDNSKPVNFLAMTVNFIIRMLKF
ncbi:hypothetical protein [Nitrosovibrio sp. Nv6]|uniref:hypothetical protein n=1 Tax=Nitrosovibrio sp. Nv6 TaxID=1855340 RepID=UPI0008C41D56|nr:hypothetical protein [Nitrosovibrio sp. Nv6]SEO86603.1 hypothetical protein SAMN05216316_1306 [Nitrosovibrio sp. Nv6]